MTENLRLGANDTSGNPRTLTTSDTNISTSEISSGSYTFPSGTDLTVWVDPSYSTPQIDRSPYSDNNGNKYGNYYNYLAATLGVGATSKTSGSIASSVCPKGWRLPAYEGTGSFQSLGSAYNLSKSNVWNTIRIAPLYYPASGYYNKGIDDRGSIGKYWTRQVSDKYGAFALYFSDNYYDSQRSESKYYGFSVRCVFGG